MNKLFIVIFIFGFSQLFSISEIDSLKEEYQNASNDEKRLELPKKNKR